MSIPTIHCYQTDFSLSMHSPLPQHNTCGLMENFNLDPTSSRICPNNGAFLHKTSSPHYPQSNGENKISSALHSYNIEIYHPVKTASHPPKNYMEIFIDHQRNGSRNSKRLKNKLGKPCRYQKTSTTNISICFITHNI